MRRLVLRHQGYRRSCGHEGGQVESIGREPDDRKIAGQRFAVDDAVVHHQHLFGAAFDDRAALGVVDEVDAFLSRIGNEDAAEAIVRKPFADLQEQALVDLAERAFLDDQGQQIGS